MSSFQQSRQLFRHKSLLHKNITDWPWWGQWARPYCEAFHVITTASCSSDLCQPQPSGLQTLIWEPCMTAIRIHGEPLQLQRPLSSSSMFSKLIVFPTIPIQMLQPTMTCLYPWVMSVSLQHQLLSKHMGQTPCVTFQALGHKILINVVQMFWNCSALWRCGIMKCF